MQSDIWQIWRFDICFWSLIPWPIRARILVHKISGILQEQVGRPRSSNHIPEEMVLPGWASHIVLASVTGIFALFTGSMRESLGVAADYLFCCKKRDHLNSGTVNIELVNSTRLYCSIFIDNVRGDLSLGEMIWDESNFAKTTICSSDAASNTFQ